MIRVLILEDNKKSLQAITAMVKQVSAQIEVLPADSVLKAQAYLDETQQRIHAFLLDINLDAGNEDDQGGIEFARKVRRYKAYAFTPIVMITSVANLELQAYRELHCYQYILKPYQPEDVEKLIKDVLFQAGGSVQQSITVKKDGINYKIVCSRIICIKAITRGIELTLLSKNGKDVETMTIPYLTIHKLKEQLPEDMFIQTHRMFVVNKEHIEAVDYVNRFIQMKHQITVEIGVTHRNEIKNRINQ